MSGAPIVFDNVSKKFRRGERHDSLRDLVPALLRGALGRRQAEVLESDEFWAVRDVSFEVKPGEALGIIGSNGAGKSTTLKILNRILKPTSGRCMVKGRVGALIEVAAGFHPDLTGRENVYLQGAIMGMSRADIAARFDQIVEFAGLSAFIDTPVKRYSSGMNARLGFAIAAHLNPDVLIIDEVLSVGDMSFQRRCVDRMQEFLREGVAIAFVSHNLPAVRSMCQNTLLLKQGVPLALGPTTTVLQRYIAGNADAAPPPKADGSASLEVTSVTVTGDETLMALRPGDEMQLTLRARAVKPLSQLILVTYVVEETSQVAAFNCNTPVSTIVGEREGATSLDLSIRLTLNLLRGLYSVSFSLYDPERQEHLVWLRPARTVGIQEDESYGGIAHLALRVVNVRTMDDAEPALVVETVR